MLRRSFPLPPASGGGGGGALAVTVRLDPLESYNPLVSGYSTLTQRCTASGGTPPYTYAWARQSGSTDIGGGGGTADETTFSASGDGSPTSSYSAVWRITVTDDVAATATYDFTVTFYFGISTP